jgi:ABC-type Fe3+-citrate transport system substrate-binding protein
LNKQLVGLLAGLMAIALVVAGCGSSSNDDSSSSTTASLSKAEFVKEANAICTKGGKSINAEFEEFSKENNLSQTKAPPKQVQEEAVEQILIPSIRRQVDEVKALGTPEGDEGELQEAIAAQEEVIEEGEEDPVTLLEGESAKQKEANKMARDYGLTVCGSENG